MQPGTGALSDSELKGEIMNERITEAQFAMQCAFVAKNAASWAGDILTLPERYNQASSPSSVGRFTDEMRGRLDRLDAWAGRTAAPDGLNALLKEAAGTLQYFVQKGQAADSVGELVNKIHAAIAKPASNHAAVLRRVERGARLQASVMRDPLRTGGWEGAEKVADAFEDIADRAAEALTTDT
jgi:hypothetical protein